MGASLHGRHGRLFSDGAGDDEKRQIQAAPLKDGECSRGAETRHDVVGDHRIPWLRRKRGFHGRGRVDALEDRVVTAAAEFPHEEGRVVFGVLDHQHAQRVGHRSDARECRRGLVEQQPVHAQRADGIDKLAEVDRLADIAVGAQGVAASEVLLLIG